MTDTTDTARLVATVRETAADHQTVHSQDRDRKDLFMQCADALERLAAENAELRTKLDAAVQMLAGWCRAVAENGTGWDGWDEHYKDAAYRDGPLRAMIDDAMAEGKGDG